MTSVTNRQEAAMTRKGTSRRLGSAATFATAAILVAMLVQLIVALVLGAAISIWGLLSVTLSESSDASSIGLGFNLGQTVLLWLLLTLIGVLPWGQAPQGDSRAARRVADSSRSTGND